MTHIALLLLGGTGPHGPFVALIPHVKLTFEPFATSELSVMPFVSNV